MEAFVNKMLSAKEAGRIPARQLADLAKSGIVQVMMPTTINPNHVKKTDLPQYKKHAHFKGTKISISEAARVFKIPQPTISRWVNRQIIKILERTDREIYLDKADMAYCAEIYHERGGMGRWLFNDDGTPYIKTT